MSTANYGWDHIATNQASKEVTANGVFDAIDGQVKANDTAAEKVANKNVAGGYPGLVAAPVAHNSTGVAGSFAVDSSNVYICLAANSWLRISSAGVFSTSF